MSDVKGNTVYDGENIGIEFEPLVGGEKVKHCMKREHDGEWPVQFFTRTTDMRDFIANVTCVDRKRKVCSVEGVYRGRMQDLQNVRVCFDLGKNVPKRVMVTEHVNAKTGKFGFIATTERVLIDSCHFVNVGWSDKKRCRFVRADLYTGEATSSEGPRNDRLYRGEVKNGI